MHIHIKNFRCFVDTSVTFQSNWNVVVGHGKSALLDAIRCCICPRAHLPKSAYSSPLRAGEELGQVTLEMPSGSARLKITQHEAVREGRSGVEFFCHVRTDRKDPFEDPYKDSDIYDWLNLLESNARTHYIFAEEHPDQIRFRDVKRILKHICGFDLVPCFRGFLVQYQDVVLPFRDLPESVQNLAQWVGGLLRRWVNHPGFHHIPEFNLHMEGLTLVDNFDQNLPPYEQQLLPRKLQECFPQMKFIVTTNALPSLLDCAELIHLRSPFDGSAGIIAVTCSIPPDVDVNFLAFQYGGMPSPGSSARMALMERYRLALRAGEPVEELEAELRRYVGPFADTSLERLAWGVAAQLMQEEISSITPERRETLRKQVLERLRAQKAERENSKV